MNERRDKNSLPQDQFEAITKRAAEMAVPLAADVVREMVREEMANMRKDQIENASHYLNEIIGASTVKGAFKVVWVALGVIAGGIGAELLSLLKTGHLIK